MNIDNELIRKCVALDKTNMEDCFLDGNGNPIDWDKLENIIIRAIEKGAILKSITEQEILKGYFLYRVRDNQAYVLSIQVENPGENPFILKKLLKMACLEMNNDGFSWINTSADKNNLKSISLHQKLGFELVEEKATSLSFRVQRKDLLGRLYSIFK